VPNDIESYEGGQQIMFGKYCEFVIKRINQNKVVYKYPKIRIIDYLDNNDYLLFL